MLQGVLQYNQIVASTCFLRNGYKNQNKVTTERKQPACTEAGIPKGPASHLQQA